LENSYRFSASQAYFRLVQARIEELREQRIEVPTIGEFMERRLAPAMNTCQAIARRQEALASASPYQRPVAHPHRHRAGAPEPPDPGIHEYPSRPAAEAAAGGGGLSVAAISYYVIGLLGYAGKAARRPACRSIRTWPPGWSCRWWRPASGWACAACTRTGQPLTMAKANGAHRLGDAPR
jgi:hypothetical protein